MTGRRGTLALLVALAGCRHLLGAPAISECPGTLRSTDEIEGEFLLRQRMRLSAPDRELSLDLAVEKRDGELVVVGFHPLGARSFSLIQRGRHVEVDAWSRRVLPVPPVNVLRDLHRARFLALPPPQGGEGVSEATLDGTHITEYWRGGRRTRRVFRREDGSPAGVVQVDFDDERSTRIDNAWCGYRVTLVDVSQEPLP